MKDREMIPDLLSESVAVDWQFLLDKGILFSVDEQTTAREIIHAAYLEFRNERHLGKSVIDTEIHFVIRKWAVEAILSDCSNGKYNRLRFQGL